VSETARIPEHVPSRVRLEAAVGRLLGRLPGAVARALACERPLVLDGLTLDPHVQAIRASRARLHPHGLCEPTVEAGRRRYTREVLALHPRPTPVADVRALRVAGAAGELDARLYVPPAPGDALLVYFHGGGFVIGDLDTHDEPCRQLCAWAGTRVLSVAYRLAPEHPFPAALEDALAAFRWARAHAASLGADPARVSAGGDSAGGQLATVVSRTLAATSDRPRAQLLLYPVTQFGPRTRSHDLFGDARLILESRDMTAFRRLLTSGVAVAEEDPRLSPLLAETFAEQPPALVVTAGFDPLRDEGRAYAERLRAAGSRVEALEFGSLVHGFVHMTTVSPGARSAMRRMAEAWRGVALGVR
jgi:acetyl esterase